MQNLAEYRREMALKELGTTQVKRNVSIIGLVIFSGTLLSVPLCQFVSDIHRGESPQIFRAASLLPIPNLKKIEAYEDRLEEESLLTHWILPSVQTILTRVFRTGNEQVYLGRDGWLFYRADVDSVIGANFQTLGTAWGAILDFNRQLEARDITLIVVPTPVKPTIHPEKFSSRYRNVDAPIHNPAYATFVETLISEGVLVYDPSPLLSDSAHQEMQYLETDTHWKPKAMEQVAKHLAVFIAEQVELSANRSLAYIKTAEDTANIGDIAKMLKLPEDQMLFPQEHVTRHVVQTPSGELWQPDQESEILFLGDSFSNIYSLAGMGWGIQPVSLNTSVQNLSDRLIGLSSTRVVPLRRVRFLCRNSTAGVIVLLANVSLSISSRHGNFSLVVGNCYRYHRFNPLCRPIKSLQIKVKT